MAQRGPSRTKETTTTTGTGSLTLAGAVAGFRSFASGMSVGDTCWALIQNADASEWELSLCTLSGGTTLARTTVYKSTNADALVNFSAGTKTVFVTQPGEKSLYICGDGAYQMFSSAEPVAPISGMVKFFVGDMAGRLVPAWLDPVSSEAPLQPLLGSKCVRIIGTGTGTTTALVVSWSNIQIVCVGGTLSQTTPATGSFKSRMRFSSLQSAATAGAIASVKGSQLEVARETGFFFVQRFVLDTLIASCFGFWGLYASVTAPGATVDFTTSTAVAKIGLGLNTNTGNWKLITCSGATVTATDLGASFPINTTDVMELVLSCVPGGSTIGYRITNLTTGATTSGTTSSDLIGSTTYVTPLSRLSNNATASAVKWSHKIVYLETDY